MDKLIKNKLAQGMLLTIDKEFLINRYNEALLKLINKQTRLKSFTIDALGHSPEIEEELGMKNYLNKGNINQKFIIVSLEQKDLPILNTSFTNKRHLWREFIEDNLDVIANLSVLSSIYGEIENNIVKVSCIEDLVSMDKLKFTIETPKKLIKKSKDFLDLIKEFKIGDNCLNKDLVDKMIDISKEVGDVFNKPIIPRKTEYNVNSFYTSHLEGFYLFRDSNDFKNIILIPKQYTGRNYSELLPSFDVDVINFNEENICSFLTDYNLVDVFDEDFYKENITIIKNKIDYLVIDILAKENKNKNLLNLNENDIKNYIFDNYENLPKSYKDLEVIYKKLQKNLKVDIDNISLRTKFMLMKPKEDLGNNEKDLIRHLITNFDKTDFMRTYAFNKNLFFDRYSKYNDNYKDYISDMLLKNYVPHRREIKERI